MADRAIYAYATAYDKFQKRTIVCSFIINCYDTKSFLVRVGVERSVYRRTFIDAYVRGVYASPWSERRPISDTKNCRNNVFCRPISTDLISAGIQLNMD